jgi:deazaflavin-dependent oxidoreductase (nitroreductase family)
MTAFRHRRPTDRREVTPASSAQPVGMDTNFVAGAPRRSLPIRSLARFVNPVVGPIAGSRLLPLWALLGHTGRRSGRVYRTPVVALPTEDGFIVPLPFGDRTQWAHNLTAVGAGTLRRAGRDWRITQPQVVEFAQVRDQFNPVLRFLVSRIGIRHFVKVRAITA